MDNILSSKDSNKQQPDIENQSPINVLNKTNVSEEPDKGAACERERTRTISSMGTAIYFCCGSVIIIEETLIKYISIILGVYIMLALFYDYAFFFIKGQLNVLDVYNVWIAWSLIEILFLSYAIFAYFHYIVKEKNFSLKSIFVCFLMLSIDLAVRKIFFHFEIGFPHLPKNIYSLF